MYALVFNNKVIQISETNFCVHPSLIWTTIPTGQNVQVGWIYTDGVLSAPPEPDLFSVKTAQLSILSRSCARQIVSGVNSSALGEAYIYASDGVDQRNILLAAQSAKGGLLSCQNASGVWARVAHTQAQAQQVLEDFVTARDAARTKLTGLETQISAATTVEAVQAVLWESTGG